MRLPQVWEYFNEVAFGGHMVRPPIFLYKSLAIQVKKKQYEVFGAYAGKPTWGIWLSKEGLKDIYETLYHEMCHQFLEEIEGEIEHGHGERFKTVYNKGLERLMKTKKKV